MVQRSACSSFARLLRLRRVRIRGSDDNGHARDYPLVSRSNRMYISYAVSPLDKLLNPSKTIEGEVEERENKLVVEKSRSFSTLVSLRFGVTRELGVVKLA